MINRERIVVLGWGRAILLQLAHPLVAAGVRDHSGYSAGRLGRLDRLHATVSAMLDLTFGDEARVARAAARINAVHRRVHGRLRHETTAFGAGTAYTATDPELLLWVHVTLLDSVPLAFERFVGPLTTAEKDDYCLRSVPTAEMLGIPRERLPAHAREVQEILAAAQASGRLHVTPDARAIARELLYPPLDDPTRPAAWLTRLVTLGLLPAAIRDAYHFGWNSRRDRAFRAVATVLRATWPRLPGVVRHWPASRH